MADDIINKQEQEKIPEKNISAGEQPVAFRHESEPARESKEISQDEKIVAQELRQEIELMDIEDNLKKEAEQKANKMQFLADDEKLENLLRVAREKGIVFAINVAKSMNDPFLLDKFHDILAKEGYYKKFVKE